MFLIKKIQGVLLLLLVLLLSSCGGGGSSRGNGNTNIAGQNNPIPFSLNSTPDGVNSSYQGKTTSAQLTQLQSLRFLEALFGFSLVDNIDIGNTVPGAGKFAKSYARQINFSDTGLVSGSYRITGDINQRGGVLTAVWKDYSNVEGSLLDGKAIFNIVGVDSAGNIIKSTTRYIELNIKNKQQNVLVNGYSIEQFNDNNGYTTTIYDMSLLDKNTNKWIALDKLKERINLDNRELNGRFYQGDLGYIDIQTLQTLQQCINCENKHPVEGKLIFRDSHNNTANFTFIPGRGSANKIELVFNRPDSEPEKKKLDWREFATWKQENHPPRIAELYDPPFYLDTYKKNYIDSLKLTFSSGDKYYDDDGDKVTLSYDWYVNGNLITTNHTDTLSVPSFKAGDDVKIKITADDGYDQVTQTVTGQSIVDTRSVISIKPIQKVIVGKEFILDASETYDADVGELSYKWTIGKPGVGSWVQVDEAVITERYKVQTKARILESGRYELTLDVTQKKAQAEPTLTSKRIIFQVTDDTEQFFPEAYFSHPVSQNLFMSLDDVTGDGKANILLTFKDKKEIAILNKVDSYEPIILIKLNKLPVAKPLVRDINADGRKDIIVLHEKGVSLLTQNSQGGFDANYVDMDMNVFNKSFITGDFNHDGLIDIAVVTKPTTMSLAVLFQKTVNSQGRVEFYPAVAKRLTNTNYYFDLENPHLTVTDFNQDGIDDIILWANSELDSSDKIVLILSNFSITDRNANSEILMPPDYILSFNQKDFKLPGVENGDKITDIVFADFNNDNKLEILEIHDQGETPYFYVYSQQGDQYNTQLRKKYTLSNAGKFAVTDIDKDGQDDIYYLSWNSAYEKYSLVYHLSNNGKPGVVRQQLKLQSDPRPDFVDIGDINGDGKNDIVILYPDKFGIIYAK